MIIDYLDTSKDVYFIVTGQVGAKIYSASGKAITFSQIGSGEILGEYAAIDGEPRSVCIEAQTECVIATMSAVAFNQVLEDEPDFTRALLRHLVKKIRHLTTRVYEVSALSVNNRIKAELLRLAQLAHRSGKSVVLASPPTHAEIASRTSTHREAVTREFSRLARIGLIERKGRTLVIKDLDRLEELVRQSTEE